MINRKSTQRKIAWDDKIFDWFCRLFLIFFVIIVAYPICFIVFASFSSPEIVNSGKILLFPQDIQLDGYKMVFQQKDIWIGYRNTICYTACGTILGTAAVVMAGYAVSRRNLLGRGIIMKIMVFTMYFSGGTIPQFLVVRQLGLLDTRAIMIIAGAVSAYNIIIVRSFMQSNIPEELYDAAAIDGCGQGTFFVKVVLPLSKAVISVIVLYNAVAYWNSYFAAMMYLSDSNKFPLQLILRQLLLMTSSLGNTKDAILADPEYAIYLKQLTMVMKYSVIVVSTVPILCIYPFIQKYFMKGVMIGSVKG